MKVRCVWIVLFIILKSVMPASALEVYPLNKGWTFWRGFESSEKENVELPHTWNRADGMFGNTDYYRGLCTYRKVLQIPAEWEEKRIFLKVDAAQTIADIFIDNKFVTQHRGGYTAFVTELTDFVEPGNEARLDIRVNNTATMDIAPLSGDFNIFGGLYRGVHLLVTDSDMCIDPAFYGASGVFFSQTEVSRKSATLTVRTLLLDRKEKYENPEVEFQLWEGKKQIAVSKKVGVDDLLNQQTDMIFRDRPQITMEVRVNNQSWSEDLILIYSVDYQIIDCIFDDLFVSLWKQISYDFQRT